MNLFVLFDVAQLFWVPTRRVSCESGPDGSSEAPLTMLSCNSDPSSSSADGRLSSDPGHSNCSPGAAESWEPGWECPCRSVMRPRRKH